MRGDNRPCSSCPTSVADVYGWWANGQWFWHTGRTDSIPAAACVCGDVCGTCATAEGTLSDPARDCWIVAELSPRNATNWARSRSGLSCVPASAPVFGVLDAVVEGVPA